MVSQLFLGVVGSQKTEEWDMVPVIQDYELDRIYTWETMQWRCRLKTHLTVGRVIIESNVARKIIIKM